MSAIFEREFKACFKSIIGYVFISFILLFAGIYTVAVNLFSGLSTFEYVLGNMTIVYLLGIPILTMRSFAEERHQKTDQLLYALPTGIPKIVWGKYLATVSVLALPLLFMCLYPLILSLFGSVYFLNTYSSILAFFLLGAALCAIGLFFSSLTENQVIAAVATLAVFLVNYYGVALSSLLSNTDRTSVIAFSVLIVLAAVLTFFVSKNVVLGAGVLVVPEAVLLVFYFLKKESFEGMFQSFMKEISLFNRFYVFIDGTFDLTAIVMDLVVIAVFICLTVQSMEKRRWS